MGSGCCRHLDTTEEQMGEARLERDDPPRDQVSSKMIESFSTSSPISKKNQVDPAVSAGGSTNQNITKNTTRRDGRLGCVQTEIVGTVHDEGAACVPQELLQIRPVTEEQRKELAPPIEITNPSGMARAVTYEGLGFIKNTGIVLVLKKSPKRKSVLKCTPKNRAADHCFRKEAKFGIDVPGGNNPHLVHIIKNDNLLEVSDLGPESTTAQWGFQHHLCYSATETPFYNETDLNIYSAKLKEQGLTPEAAYAEILTCYDQVLLGLEEIWEASYIHLDIKPSNIFVQKEKHHPSARYAVGDFGSCESIKENTNITRNNKNEMNRQIDITPKYAAPELLTFKNSSTPGSFVLSESLDIFSFGETMKEVLQTWSVGVLPKTLNEHFEAMTDRTPVYDAEQHLGRMQLRNLRSNVFGVTATARGLSLITDTLSTTLLERFKLTPVLSFTLTVQNCVKQHINTPLDPPIIPNKLNKSVVAWAEFVTLACLHCLHICIHRLKPISENFIDNALQKLPVQQQTDQTDVEQSKETELLKEAVKYEKFKLLTDTCLAKLKQIWKMAEKVADPQFDEISVWDEITVSQEIQLLNKLKTLSLALPVWKNLDPIQKDLLRHFMFGNTNKGELDVC